ncbi:glycoside hydrolase family 30 protein [Negadavirga shengliensis]|uniref:Glycoside hydrolase family 30 beta sandwich domain-containing protein n=1 Tax=Negadavirga shengliensis TaxID=1389218 RepID=A0ABV9T1T9_9BACT
MGSISVRLRDLVSLTIGTLLLVHLNACSGDGPPGYEPPKQAEEIGKASLWLTTGDRSKLLNQETDIPITKLDDSSLPAITLSLEDKKQHIEGFGAALTGSAAYLIQQKMNPSQRHALLQELFDPGVGIGLSYLRMTIGSSDFSLSDYTYNDLPHGQTDYNLERFSIEKDREDVIPVFREIINIAPNLKIMGSPWSPPAWMKTNNNLRGGKLKPEAYEVYAEYFVKYIEAFQAEGITVDAVTVQNEPLHFTAGYPCMEMNSEEQNVFIRDFLGPKFKSKGISTDIILYDHNWDNTHFAISILNDPETREYVSGSAFHGYAGHVDATGIVHSSHPDKGLYFTEISGGEWATNFSDNLQWNMSNIFIGTTRNWSKNVLMWNLALDQDFGPKNNGCQNCRGVVTINNNNGQVTRNVEYYSLGHFSKFVRPGAWRVGSNTSGNMDGIEHVAFSDQSGKKVVVISNNNNEAKELKVKADGGQLIYNLPAKSVITLVWN